MNLTMHFKKRYLGEVWGTVKDDPFRFKWTKEENAGGWAADILLAPRGEPVWGLLPSLQLMSLKYIYQIS